MNKLLMRVSIAAAGGLLCASPSFAQMPPTAPKASKVTITQQPMMEIAHDDTVIVSWTTNNPGGSNDHYGVVQYGTSPTALTQTAKSHIRLNLGHLETRFRVRIRGLQPQTTYYYTVTSQDAQGVSDGIVSGVNQFTTPAPGQRIVIDVPATN